MPLCLLMCLTLVGCARNSPKLSIVQPSPDIQSTAKSASVTPKAAASSIQTLAKVDNVPVNLADLTPSLIEAAGGQVLSERIMSMKIREKLGKTIITEDQIQAERQIFVSSLHPDTKVGEQLLKQLRDREGLGPNRFDDFLFRQAALRHLVSDQVTVTDQAINQAYELRYGPASVVQIIVIDNTADAVRILNRARKGEAFGQLVQQFSQNPASKATNGILDPISPVDASYPTALHKAIARLEVGQISDVVALDNGFAILKLLSKNARQSVTLDDVKASLAVKVRREVEQMLMRQMAATLMRQADVVVLDRALNQSWQTNKNNLP